MHEARKRSSALLLGTVLALTSIGVAFAAASYMDYFQATPLIGSLSSSCWGAPEVGPRDQSNGLEDKTMTKYCYWDGAIIKGTDGRYHMFASRWNQSAGHNGWFGSVAVHATSSNLYGPYTDQGLVWPNDANGQGHNVLALVMKDGRYAVYCSETRRPTVVYVSSNLNGPWTKLGTVSVTGPSASGFTHSNVYIMLRPDGRYGIISRDGLVGVADNILGPYNITGRNIYTQAPGMPTGNVEDPCMWYSGGVYHVIANKWDTRKAYHLTSPDGISNWKLDTGYAFDPTANFIRYTNGTVNHWNKLERPNVYMENGHVVAMTLAAIDVAKDKDVGNDRHGSKVIVIPFDGARLDGGDVTPTPTQSPTVTPTPTPTKSTVVTPTPTKSTAPTPTPTASQNVTGCTVSYSQSDWGSGASVSLTIKNNGTAPINGWTLAWSFAGNQAITNMWNGTYTQSGTAVTVKNAAYNSAIPAKGSVSFGFNLSYSGANVKPTAFTLNGAACPIE